MSVGLSPFGALSPADIARLMQQARPMEPQADEVPDAVPPGFSGFVPPSAPTMRPQAMAAPAPLAPPPSPNPQATAPAPSPASLPSLVGQSPPPMPLAPAVAASLTPSRPAVPAPSEDEADKPVPNAVPAQGRAPLSLAPLSAPTAPAAPAVPAPAAAAGPSFGDRFASGLKQNGDLLIGLGTGLMSTRGVGNGLAAGLQYAQKAEKDRAVTDLAKAEFGLKSQKAAQEQRALTGNAQYVQSKIPGISADQAVTLGSNSTFMNELFKGVLPPTELFKQYQDKDGNIWSQNARTGQATVALKADEDKTVTPVSEDDRVKLGLPAGSYQKDANGKISPINPTGTTINMGGEKAYDAEVGKTYAKQFSEVQTAGRNATNKLNSLALIEQQMTSPNFYSGYGGEQVKRFNQLLGAIGIKDARTASPAEVVDALSNQVVLDQLGGSLGAGISDSDRKSIALIGPGIAKTPEGNRQLIGIYRSIAQREQQVAQMARDYSKANGGRIDAGFDDQVAKFALDNPLFPAAQGGATAKSDGVTDPSAAGGIASPRTQADFDALPTGTVYIDPATGKRYRK